VVASIPYVRRFGSVTTEILLRAPAGRVLTAPDVRQSVACDAIGLMEADEEPLKGMTPGM
jgi:hypothetical protein